MRADVIPQLADAAEVLARHRRARRGRRAGTDPQPPRPGDALEALAADAAATPWTAFDEINVFMSASETHNRKNVNRTDRRVAE